MVKISQYEQNQLASPAVGTPGVDTSNASALSSMASGFGGLATNINQLAAQENAQQQADLREKQKNMEALVKVQIKMAQGVEVANRSLEMNMQLHKYATLKRDENKETPELLPDLIMKEGKDVIQQYAEGVTDPEVKAELIKNGATQLDNHVNGANTWMVEQKTKLAFNHANNAIQNLISTAGNPAMTPDIKSLQALHQQAKELIPPNQLLFGEKAGTIMQDTIEKMNGQFLEAKLLQEPEKAGAELKALLQSGAFGQGLPADKRADLQRQYEMRINAAVKEQKKEAETAIRTQMIMKESESFGIVTDPTTTKTQKASSLRQAAADKEDLAKSLAKTDPKLSNDLMSDARRDVNEAESLEGKEKAEGKEAITLSEKQQAKRAKEKAEAKVANLNSPKGAKVRVDLNQRFVKNLKNTSSPTFIKDMQTLQRDVQIWQSKGHVGDADARELMEDITSAVKTYKKPGPGPLDGIIKGADRIGKWAQSLGAPKDVAKSMDAETQVEYRKRLRFIQNRFGKEANAAQRAQAEEDAKESVRRKRRPGL